VRILQGILKEPVRDPYRYGILKESARNPEGSWPDPAGDLSGSPKESARSTGQEPGQK